MTDRRTKQTSDAFVAEDLRQMQQAKNYHRWTTSLMQPHLGKRIFEVGSGVGSITEVLLRDADLVYGIEPNASCLEELDRRLGSNAKFQRKASLLEECRPEELRRFNFDTVVCMNVLEHIQNDIAALRICHALLEEDGTIILFLPASPFAFGPLDLALGHFRRYSKRTATRVLAEAGFTIHACRYVNALGLLGWFFNARIRRAVRQNDAQIRLFDRLVPVLSGIEKIIHPLIGLSLLVTAKKETP